MRARHAAGLCAFYGRAAIELSLEQVLYYIELLNDGKEEGKKGGGTEATFDEPEEKGQPTYRAETLRTWIPAPDQD